MPELFTSESVEAAMSAPAPTTETPASTESTAPSGVSPVTETAATAPGASDSLSTTPVAQTDSTTVQPTKQGPIPFESHKTALENARTKASQEIEAKYAWAQNIPEQHRQTMGQLTQLLDTEPTQALEVLIGQIANDPRHAPKLRSLFGKMLGTRPQPQTQEPPAGAFPEADAEGVDDQGRRIPLYSATQMQAFAKSIEARIDAKYSQKLGPLENDFRTRKDTEAEATRKAAADQWAETEYADISATLTGFKEHEAEIAQAMADHPEWTVDRAYNRIVVPKLSQSERTKVVASLHQKTEAASQNPSSGAISSQGPSKSFEEAITRAGGIRF